MLYCRNVTRLAVRVAVYVRTVTVLHKHYTSGLNLPCANITINIITVPFWWGSLPDRDEYLRVCHSVRTGSGGRGVTEILKTNAHIPFRSHAVSLMV
jgi:hypothetical protein